MNALAASGLPAVERIATGSVTALTPDSGNTNSTGEPFALARIGTKSTTIP